MEKCRVAIKTEDGGERSDWCAFGVTYVVSKVVLTDDDQYDVEQRASCPSHLAVVIRQMDGDRWVVTKVEGV